MAVREIILRLGSLKRRVAPFATQRDGCTRSLQFCMLSKFQRFPANRICAITEIKKKELQHPTMGGKTREEEEEEEESIRRDDDSYRQM